MRTGKQQAGRAIRIAYGLDGDPAAVATVQRIFAEFAHPYRHATLSEIAAGLNIDQAATQRGGQWHASTVRYVLRNPVYMELVGADVFDAAQSRLSRLRPGPPR